MDGPSSIQIATDYCREARLLLQRWEPAPASAKALLDNAEAALESASDATEHERMNAAKLRAQIHDLEQLAENLGNRSPTRFDRGLDWLVPSLLAAAALIVGWFALTLPRETTNLATTATIQVSSSSGPFGPSGLSNGDTKATGVTTQEQVDPFVVLDVGKVEYFDKIIVYNRTDCCRDAALPLVVEISLDGVTYGELARQPNTYRIWTIERSARARFFRFTSPGEHALHLSEIKILTQ